MLYDNINQSIKQLLSDPFHLASSHHLQMKQLNNQHHDAFAIISETRIVTYIEFKASAFPPVPIYRRGFVSDVRRLPRLVHQKCNVWIGLLLMRIELHHESFL